MIDALLEHWPEYLMEAAGLGLFMVSAAVFGMVLFFPASAIARAVPDPLARRALMGIAMGLTLVGLVYSPWGTRSGAHLNPAVTLTFWRLGKIARVDAAFYGISQVAGGTAGLALVSALPGSRLASPSVAFVTTVPGPWGSAGAFAGEVVISFVMMLTVLIASNHDRLARYTGLLAAGLLALFIAAESPASGTSLNPARTFASAAVSGIWTGFWIYLVAPPLAMLAAGETYLRLRGRRAVICAKLHHASRYRCIFRCGFGGRSEAASPVPIDERPTAGDGLPERERRALRAR